MSVKVIFEPNPASAKRTTLHAEPKPVADIIRELDTGFPLPRARVSRNGEIVTDFSIIAQDGDTLWIKFVPGSTGQTGTGMKIGGWALALVGLALTIFTAGIGASVGVMLIGTGVSLALTGAALLNINIPSLGDYEKPDNDPSIRGGKNQARPHGRVPVLFGRHRLYPDLAANPHTEIIDGKQYYTQLLCGGYRDCVIDLDSIKLGETPLADLSQSKSIEQILAGTDPLIQMEILQNGEPSSLYPHCVHEEAVNAVLENMVDDGNGGKISGEVIRTTPDKTDTVNVDIFFYNGLGRYEDDGDLVSASVEVRAYYKKASDPDSAYLPLGNFSGVSNIISAAELKTKRFQITKSGLVPDQYSIKIERVTPDSGNSKVVDQVYVGSVRSIKSVRPDGVKVRPIRYERQKDLTIIALRVMAAGKLNGVVDSLNYIATSKLPVYSGSGSGKNSWLSSAETRNPAAMLLYALKGRAAQQIVDDTDIDWLALESFYLWCGEHGYFCDAYLSQSVTIAELLRMIGSTAHADILRVDSKISVVQDIERPSPVQLFTPKNTVSYSVTMFSADIPDAVSLRYIDADSGYAQNECQVYNTPDGNRVSEPETIQKVDLWGITGSAQARRIGMYNYGCLKHRPFAHTIEVDIEYLLCDKGDWIQYAGDIALAGSTQGRIREINTDGNGRCTGFIADEPVEMDTGKTYAVRIRTADGTVILENIRTNPAAVNEIEFISPVQEGVLPKQGDLYAFGVRRAEVIDLVITDIQPGQNLSATLTCVEYSPAIFAVDGPDFVLPEFENKITPVSGAVDSGVVTPDNWKFFTTYHDSEEEPQRPAGDGEDGGWHHARTPLSVWQSGKTAETVSDGTWGPPVRLKAEAGKYPDFRFAKSTGVTDAPPVSIDTDNPGNNWTDTPPPVADNEYLWMTTAEWRETIRLTAWSAPSRISGPAGPAGQSAVYLNLDNENHSIACDHDGNPQPGSLGFTVNATVYDGVSAVNPADAVFDVVTTATGITISSNGAVTVATDAVLQDVTLVTVEALYKGTAYYATLTLVKVKDGSAGLDGAPAVTYRLVPLVSVIKKDKDGNLAPATPVTCVQYKYEAGQETVSTERLEYQLSTMAGGAAYPAAGVTVGDAAWVEFTLYSGADMILDRQRVPVVADGQTGQDGSYYEPRYQRAAVQPAIPEGDNPSGWTTTPPEGINPLWMIRGLKSAGGNLVVTKYRNDAAWTGWIASTNYPEGEVTVSNGIISATGRKYFDISPGLTVTSGDIIILRARQTSGTLSNLYVNIISSSNVFNGVPVGQLSRDWKTFCFVIPENTVAIPHVFRYDYGTVEGTLELSDFYVGDASFLTPVIDNAGNNRHAQITSGVVPVEGKSGKGIQFLPGLAKTSIPNSVFQNDFTLSFWMKPSQVSNWMGVMGTYNSGWHLAINTTNLYFVVKTSDSETGRPVSSGIVANELIHVNIKIRLGILTCKINNVVKSSYSNVVIPDFTPLSDFALGGAGPNYPSLLGTLDEIALFNRATTDAEDYALFKTSLPKNYTSADWLLDKNNPAGVYEGRYLGKTVTAPTGNVVLIQTTAPLTLDVGAKPKDWVAYVGEGNGAWLKNYCYQWNSTQWVQLDPLSSATTALYMSALADIGDGATSEVFSALLVRKLIAQQAAIEELQTKVITLQQGGVLQSANYAAGSAGFKLGYDGNAEFNNGTFRGHIEAESGTFNGHIEAESGYFKGEMESGPLISNKPQTTPGPTITYSSGTLVNTIMAAEFSRFGLTTGNAPTAIDQFVTGTFNGKQLKRIYIYDQGRAGVGNFSGITFTFTDDTSSGMYYSGGSLPNALSFAYSTGEWMVKIMNLPGTDPHVAGALWQNAGDVKVSFG